jgi:hypothetical protein
VSIFFTSVVNEGVATFAGLGLDTIQRTSRDASLQLLTDLSTRSTPSLRKNQYFISSSPWSANSGEPTYTKLLTSLLKGFMRSEEYLQAVKGRYVWFLCTV